MRAVRKSRLTDIGDSSSLAYGDDPQNRFLRGQALNFHEFLKKIPKVELHVHLHGTVTAPTFVELAAKHNVDLPPFERHEDLYTYDSFADFLNIVKLVSQTIRHHDDFHRVTYECLESCARDGARYVELFFSPEPQMELGIRYPTIVEGIVSGLRDAHRDFGVECRLIPAINRELGPARAVEFVDMVADNHRPEIIGVGLDFNEDGNPAARFVDAYRLAAKKGLRLTSHAGESGSSDNVRDSIEVLRCDRIDHGYHVVDDRALLQECAQRGIVFTVCPSTTTYTTIWRDLSAGDHAIKRMIENGLKVMINSDDPPMFGTSLANEYILMADHMGFGPNDFKQFVLNGIDGAWLDESTKRQWRNEWSEQIDTLIDGLA